MSEPVTIDRIAAGGDGVGRLADGRVVFVPRTAPGDVVRLAGERLHARFVRAQLGELVAPGPGRTAPRCPHYVEDRCGGCQLQHLDTPTQHAARRAIAGDALRRIGKLELDDPPLVPAERDFDYRTRITLHAGAGGRLGLHVVDRPDRVFELDWCHITEPALNRLWQALRPFRMLLPKGLRQLVLRLDGAGERHVVAVVEGNEPWTHGKALAARLAAAGEPATIWWSPEGGAPRVMSGGEAFPATVFEQVHPAMGTRARAHAVAALGAVRDAHVWDLYAGIGDTTAQLLDAGATVESLERDARAVALAERRGAQRGEAPARVRRLAGSAEQMMGQLTAPRFVVTNPPRTGMDERVTAALGASGAERIVYISCDPATLARDLRRLADRYVVREVTAFDLFPQTAHVETVTVLDRRGGDA